MPAQVAETGCYENISVSTLVYTGACHVIGVFCASSASATCKLWDQTSAAAPILVNTFTLIAGTFYPVPADCVNGLYVTITGTADITVFYSL